MSVHKDEESPTQTSNSENKEPSFSGCEQLWQIYAEEAQNYDGGLVKSWKEDMDVILVFVRTPHTTSVDFANYKV
jgi:hypothetical protein